MLSFKRFLHIILIIVGVGGIFLIYNIHENRPASVESLPGPVPEREYMAERQVDKGDAPRVWVLGDPEDTHCGAIYSNVLQLCRDLQLTVAGEGRLNTEEAEERDLVIFCDDSPSRWANQEELTGFISGGGRVILAAGLAEGEAMDDGNLFAIYSILGAYGMVSHIFDVRSLITREDDLAAWDKSKLQIGYFESEILSRALWLEPRTLSQTEDDVRSYLNMSYGWKRSGSCVELDCGGAVKGQAFFFHTGGQIVQASGLTYLDLGEGYYLLRMQEDHGTLTLKEGT